MNLVEQADVIVGLSPRALLPGHPARRPGGRPEEIRVTSGKALRPAALPRQPRGIPGRGTDRLRRRSRAARSDGKKVVSRMPSTPYRPLRDGQRPRVRGLRAAPEVLRPKDAETHGAAPLAMAVSAHQDPLGRRAPSLVLAIGDVRALGALHRAARSGARSSWPSSTRSATPGSASTSFHFVGLENFRSILQSPSFQKALRNSIVFTLCAAGHRDRRARTSSRSRSRSPSAAAASCASSSCFRGWRPSRSARSAGSGSSTRSTA